MPEEAIAYIFDLRVGLLVVLALLASNSQNNERQICLVLPPSPRAMEMPNRLSPSGQLTWNGALTTKVRCADTVFIACG